MKRNDTPQKEKDVILECGCLGNLFGAIQRSGKDYVLCEFHDEEPQEAIREVTAKDILLRGRQKGITRANAKQEGLF